MMFRLCCGVLAGATLPVLAQPFVSTFDDSIEGWGVVTRTIPTGSFGLVGTFTPDLIDVGGANPYLSEVDPDGFWSFFSAPAAWLGDRSALLGTQLRYRTRTDTINFPDGRLVVLGNSGGERISADLGVPPVNTWMRRSVTLDEGPWFIGANGMGTPATRSEVEAVLGDLGELFIGLEFGSDTAEERVDLDDVVFGVCAADLVAPFGTLDVFDVIEYLGLFDAQDPAADLAAPAGVFDFFDVVEYLAAFDAGC
ncbi:MAG: GC-type dockerin domain-anchored protein [Planctomycetota bacterium]